ncbi:VOC family protein [Methylopila musalis]|uniref:VOC family protein n=1 Tax=Methylopila musalis TaxID=1134781 RepID=A0ABW3Z652_9HYPH
MASPRGLDHIVVLVRDLNAAAQAWGALGFQVGRENRHPFGTKNRIVQFPGFFVELLTIADPALVSEHGPRFFSFDAFQRDRLARAGEGPSGLVLESRNAAADAGLFARAGVGDFAPFFFERSGVGADGAAVDVAFELAFAVDAASPDLCFFACEQKRPENFWNAAAQDHPNGASAVAGVILTAENPSDHHVFLRAFTGIDAFRATSSGLAFETPRGEIEVLTPDAVLRRTGVAVEARPELRIAALRLKAPVAARVPPERLTGLTLLLEA